jgi:hypothetical protein
MSVDAIPVHFCLNVVQIKEVVLTFLLFAVKILSAGKQYAVLVCGYSGWWGR